mgnify:CR=1 FL=1
MGKQVARKKETEVVEFDQSMFEADAGVGVSDMGQEDLALPFLKIISGLDPLLDDPDFKGRKGDIYNTVSRVQALPWRSSNLPTRCQSLSVPAKTIKITLLAVTGLTWKKHTNTL